MGVLTTKNFPYNSNRDATKILKVILQQILFVKTMVYFGTSGEKARLIERIISIKPRLTVEPNQNVPFCGNLRCHMESGHNQPFAVPCLMGTLLVVYLLPVIKCPPSPPVVTTPPVKGELEPSLRYF